MAENGATIRLRPTRIGFLVRPNDLASIRKIMRSCTCLWGGIYNPIIPVFRIAPTEWNRDPYKSHIKGLNVAKGYINFFEPDVYVESEHGLLEEAGLGALRGKHSLQSCIISLEEFLRPQSDRDWSEPYFGLNIIDVYKDLYETEHRFQLKNERPAVLVKEENGSGLSQAIFGVFPKSKDTAYIKKGYVDVFNPDILNPTPETWLEVFKNGAETPLFLTKHKLELERTWRHDTIIFVFDPTRPTDLIDLWNLRLEPHPILPVPISWFEQLSEFISQVIKDSFRPLRGNKHGVNHHATIEFGRSIEMNIRESSLNHLKEIPTGALVVKHWRNSIWVEHVEDRVHRESRMKVTAIEQQTTIEIKEDSTWAATFKTLSPEFAAQYSGHNNRWINTLIFSEFGPKQIARVTPFNTFNRSWPKLGLGSDQITVGTEGWGFGQRFKHSTEYFTFLSHEKSVINSLESLGVEAKLSDPGHIAKQMLESLGSLREARLLADLDTLKLLNDMAGSIRRRFNDKETIEESFERHSSPIKTWTNLISKRKGKHHRIALDDFTKRNIIKLGLETNCPHCQVANWHTLTSVDYKVTCERCLKEYDFPQANLRQHNQNWYYRVIGPFSLPDFGQGSYSVLLTLRFLNQMSSARDEMSFSTALNLNFDGIEVEADFVAWRCTEKFESNTKPDLLIGEAKSFGTGDLIKQKDLTKLKQIGKKLPGAYIVISVLRDDFTDSEKEIIKSFVTWGRRLDANGLPTNPVILLTSNELFFDFMISSTWEKLGGKFKPFANFENTHNLNNFAEATLQIYLGIEPFHEWRHNEYKKKQKNRKSPNSDAKPH